MDFNVGRIVANLMSAGVYAYRKIICTSKQVSKMREYTPPV